MTTREHQRWHRQERPFTRREPPARPERHAPALSAFTSPPVRHLRTRGGGPVNPAADGYLYFTVNQLHRQKQFHEGKDLRQKPYALFRVRVDAGAVLLRREE
jgi:hypothetical protein